MSRNNHSTGRHAPPRRAKPKIGEDVPPQGDIAFSHGWDVKANPHPPNTVERLRWVSDWWRANADAFEDFIYGEIESKEGC